MASADLARRTGARWEQVARPQAEGPPVEGVLQRVLAAGRPDGILVRWVVVLAQMVLPVRQDAPVWRPEPGALGWPDQVPV